MRSRLKMAVSLAIGVLFIYWFAKKLDWAQVWLEVQQAEMGKLALAVVLLLGTYLARALRWRTLLKATAKPSIFSLLEAIVVGFMATFLVGRAGELIVRPAVLSAKQKIPPSASYATVMIERVFDMVMVVIFFAVNMAFFEFIGKDVDARQRFGLIRVTGIFLLFVSAAGIYGLSVFRRKRASVLEFLDRKLNFLPAKIKNAVISLLTQISEGLSVLHDVKSLAVTVSFTVVLWGMVVGLYLMVIRAFALPASEVPVTAAVFVMGLSMLGSVVPTPGGAAGPFHAVTAASLVFLGVDQNKAASAAIVTHIVIYGPAIVLGFLCVMKDGLSLGRLMGRQPVDSSPGAAAASEQGAGGARRIAEKAGQKAGRSRARGAAAGTGVGKARKAG